MSPHALASLVALSIVLAGCTGSPGNATKDEAAGDPPVIQGAIAIPPAQYVKWMEGWQLTQAVPLPGEAGDTLLVEREGRIHLLPAGSKTPELLLNITDLVSINAERGLSSMALHPDFEENGMLFLFYSKTTNTATHDGFSELVRYRVDPDDIRAPWEREDVLIHQEWMQWFHNAADIKFGPDGMLYVGFADGSRDRMEAQNLASLNGSILRLDVDDAPGYKIPPDNPFVDRPGARGEIWLYGLRNPWRMDFHPDTGDLYIAHSGESKVESVILFPADGNAPRNQGWPYLEGGQPFEEYAPPPEPVNMPIASYERPPGSGLCAIIGGNIYEGSLFPDLKGKFIFADHCSGKLMFTEKVGDEWHLRQWMVLDKQYINSVDAEANGELVVSTLFWRVYKIVAG